MKSTPLLFGLWALGLQSLGAFAVLHSPAPGDPKNSFRPATDQKEAEPGHDIPSPAEDSTSAPSWPPSNPLPPVNSDKLTSEEVSELLGAAPADVGSDSLPPPLPSRWPELQTLSDVLQGEARKPVEFRHWSRMKDLSAIPQPAEREKRKAEAQTSDRFHTAPHQLVSPYRFLAYDCHQPDEMKASVPPAQEVCQIPANITAQEEKEVLILQASTKRRFTAYRCLDTRSSLPFYCDSLGHSTVSTRHVRIQIPFGIEAKKCQEFWEKGYKTDDYTRILRKNGTTWVNYEAQGYTYYRAGSLSCQGGKWTPRG